MKKGNIITDEVDISQAEKWCLELFGKVPNQEELEAGQKVLNMLVKYARIGKIVEEEITLSDKQHKKIWRFL